MVLKQDFERLTEFIEVGRWYVQIFDLEVVVDLEHQHLADGVHALENREVPATIEDTANLPNES